MKTFTIGIVVLFFGISCNGFPSEHHDPSEAEFEKEFHVKHNNPEQEAKAAEELAKEEIEIDYQNDLYDAGVGHFREVLNPYSDMLPEDRERENMGLIPSPISSKRIFQTGLIWEPNRKNTPEEQARLDEMYSKMANRDSYPDSYDARDDSIVTGVKNQGSCGSCAAFATTAAVEICLAKAGASLTNLDIAEQQLVDCAYDGNSAMGCNGATMAVYPNFIAGTETNHENDYAYLGTSPNLVCQDIDYWSSGAKVDTAYVDYSCSNDKIKGLIQTYGSALIAIYASDDDFNNYASGVFDTCSSTSPNHAVLAIGWGTSDDGIDYWLIKNSWGSDWGDSGYIKLKQGTCGASNVCVALSCSAIGSADDVPTTTAAPSAGGSGCDLSVWFGSISDGRYVFEISNNGIDYTTTCDCVDTKCTPQGTSEDACTAICGNTSCP